MLRQWDALVRLVRRDALCVAIVVLGVCAPRVGFAQTAPGVVEGVGRRTDDGVPIPFTLVRLIPASAGDSAPRSGLTDAQGRFRFGGVPPGDYRLQLDLIGYDRSPGPAFRVDAGQTSTHDILTRAVPVRLPGLTGRSRSECLTLDQLDREPWLAELWREVKLGVETRRAFELQYRFTQRTDQHVTVRRRLLPDSRFSWQATMRSEPDSVVPREERYWAAHRAGEYVVRGRGRGFLITLLSEKELVDDRFLSAHCLETAAEEIDGAIPLRFRPARRPSSGMTVQGVVRVDEKTHLIRRLEYEVLDGERRIATVGLQYEDHLVDGSPLRLPARGEATGRPNAVVTLASTMVYSYLDFEREEGR